MVIFQTLMMIRLQFFVLAGIYLLIQARSRPFRKQQEPMQDLWIFSNRAPRPMMQINRLGQRSAKHIANLGLSMLRHLITFQIQGLTSVCQTCLLKHQWHKSRNYRPVKDVRLSSLVLWNQQTKLFNHPHHTLAFKCRVIHYLNYRKANRMHKVSYIIYTRMEWALMLS